MKPGRQRNDLLRQARLRIPSPTRPGMAMSRRELAEAVNAWLYQRTGKIHGMDEGHILKFEIGEYCWPRQYYRDALRALLEARSDAELGFYTKRGAPTPLLSEAGTPARAEVVPTESSPEAVVVEPGRGEYVQPSGDADGQALRLAMLGMVAGRGVARADVSGAEWVQQTIAAAEALRAYVETGAHNGHNHHPSEGSSGEE